MTPLTVNPRVVILLNEEGRVESVATNVAPDLNVMITKRPSVFDYNAANKPFSTTRPGSEIAIFQAPTQ